MENFKWYIVMPLVISLDIFHNRYQPPMFGKVQLIGNFGLVFFAHGFGLAPMVSLCYSSFSSIIFFMSRQIIDVLWDVSLVEMLKYIVIPSMSFYLKKQKDGHQPTHLFKF